MVVSCGKTKRDNRKEYIPNQLNPIFGKCFELPAAFPTNYKLKIRVMDHDFGNDDDLIGETVIDLEDRWLTKHRAACGLPALYLRLTIYSNFLNTKE